MRYGRREEILSKRLCGKIWGSTETPGNGSCDIPMLSPRSLGLVSAAGALLVVCTFASMWKFSRWENIKVSFIVLLSFVFPAIAGIVTTIAMGIRQYDTWLTCLITFIHMAVLSLFLFCWVQTMKKEKESQVEDTNY